MYWSHICWLQRATYALTVFVEYVSVLYFYDSSFTDLTRNSNFCCFPPFQCSFLCAYMKCRHESLAWIQTSKSLPTYSVCAVTHRFGFPTSPHLRSSNTDADLSHSLIQTHKTPFGICDAQTLPARKPFCHVDNVHFGYVTGCKPWFPGSIVSGCGSGGSRAVVHW